MPVDEVGIWQAYIQKNGPLALAKRVEYGFALVAMTLANIHRDPKKQEAYKLDEFMLFVRPEDQEADSIEAAAALLSTLARPAAQDGLAPKKKLWRRPKKAA